MNSNPNNQQFPRQRNYNNNGQNNPYTQNPSFYPPNNTSYGGNFPQGNYADRQPGNTPNYAVPQSQYPQQQPYPEINNNNNQKNDPDKKPKKNKKVSSLPFSEILSRIFVGALVFFVVIYMGWLFAPKIRNSMTFWPTNTPTPVTPSPTVPATPTVTPLATNTPTASPTPTPGPISTYWIANGNELDPPVPNAPEGVVILSAKNSAEIDPPFDSIYWTSSSQIVQDLGRLNSLYDTEWFATVNSGHLRYYMDQPLKEGLYEIYVMDTFYSSGGNLDFLVQIGGQTLSPLTSSSTVSFMTSQYDPRQNYDTWRSLGIYYVLPSRDVLNVSTSWGFRDQYSYVAADRIMIVPRKITDLALLNQLPAYGTRYVMDDTQADIKAGNSQFRETISTSWDDSYQLIVNPKQKSTIEYSSLEPWPIGQYSIYIYFPESKGGLDAEIQVHADNDLLGTVSGQQVVQMHIPTGGNWVLIGQYNTDRYYERPRKFKVTITIPEGQQGEYPVDAIAFIQQPFS